MDAYDDSCPYGRANIAQAITSGRWCVTRQCPQVKVVENDEYSISWALGWRLAQTENGDFINHGGDNGGFHCFAQASVQRKSGFVIMTNGDNGAELLKKLAPAVARGLDP